MEVGGLRDDLPRRCVRSEGCTRRGKEDGRWSKDEGKWTKKTCGIEKLRRTED